MEKIAIYGKGGVGKSVMATSLSVYYAMSGKNVLHIGCDPKHDSAVRLMKEHKEVRTILEVLGNDPHADFTQEILNEGRHNIHACEAGGPRPGLGCGGRGVARTIEYLDETEFLEQGDYDLVMFDVLGDVVCGGFAAPLRKGFARKLVIVASEEPMAIFAANNIARAVLSYERNGVGLAGIIANLRGKDATPDKIMSFAEKINTRVLAVVEREQKIMEAEQKGLTVLEYAPETNSAKAIGELGETILAIDSDALPLPEPMEDAVLYEYMRTWE